MPCEVVVCGFFSVYRLRHKCRYDIKGTAVQILKSFVAAPRLKAQERYCCTVRILWVLYDWAFLAIK